MANPSPEAVAAIRAVVADWTPDDATIAATLNVSSLPNPAPQGTVPKPCAESVLFPLLSSASAVKLASHPNFAVLKTDIDAGNRSGLVGLWCPVLVGGGYLSQFEADAIVEWLTGTQPDPSYPPQLSWADTHLGRPVDAADIHAARPSTP